MKVEFVLAPITMEDFEDSEIERLIEITNEIIEKVNYKVIEIPCVPSKEMRLNIESFEEVFGLSEEEIEWLENNPPFCIRDIYIKPTHLQVWLEPVGCS